MAAAETMLTSEFIRKGGSQEQYKPTGKENALIRQAKTQLREMEMPAWSDVDLLIATRSLGANATVESLIDHVTSRAYPLCPCLSSFVALHKVFCPNLAPLPLWLSSLVVAYCSCA